MDCDGKPMMKMSTRKLLLALLALFLTGCNLPSLAKTPTPQPPPVMASPTVAATDIPTTLTLTQLQNAQVTITGMSPNQQPRTIQLTNGNFESSSDSTATDYVSVNMGDQVVFGDLNGDNLQDAAIIIGENYGGTGTFISVVAMLNQNGQPTFAGSSVVDDRAIINSLAIQNSEILLNATIHGPADPGCCPAQPIKETLRLWGGQLIQATRSGKIPNGTERIIRIESPAQDSTVKGTFTMLGSVTVAPFENSLGYSIFVEGDPNPVAQSAIIVNASQMGGPGTFQLPLNLTERSLTGRLIRIQIIDISAADGSSLAIATLFVKIE